MSRNIVATQSITIAMTGNIMSLNSYLAMERLCAFAFLATTVQMNVTSDATTTS